MNRYRTITPKYKNTDVNAGTVQNLLRTINTMSQRCKTQESTDEVLKRIRSIILLHRPHLISRHDLQIPELITEALVPNTGNQITHNFNYKYDYNSNVPNSIPPNPFINANDQSQQQFYNNGSTPPVQMFTFNQTPAGSMTAPPMYGSSLNPQQQQPQQQFYPPNQVPSSTAPTTGSPCTTVMLRDEDSVALNESFQRTLRTATVQSYKQLINVLVTVSRKYILSDIYLNSVTRLETFDSLLSNDLRELLECIQRNTNWTLVGTSSSSSVCRIVSLLISAYCRLASTITRTDTFNLSSFSSIEQIERQTQSIQSSLAVIISNNDSVAMETDQVVTLNNQIESLRSEVTRRDATIVAQNTRLTLLDQRIQSLESTNTLLVTSFNSLARSANVSANVSLNNIDSIETVNSLIQSKLIEKQNQLRAVETTVGELKIENTNVISRLQSELQETRSNLDRSTRELNQARAELNARSIELEQQSQNQRYAAINTAQNTEIANLNDQLQDTRQRLTSLQDENRTLLTRVNTLTDELNTAREENLTLRNESMRPVARTKPYNRPSVGSADAANNESRIKALQKSLQDIEAINTRLASENTALKTENDTLKRDKYEIATTSQSSCDRLQADVESVRQKIENLIQNQATLNLQDITTLNQKTTDYYNTKVSELTNENQTLRDALENEITTQSDKLKERFNTSEANLQGKIERLAAQINPIAERTRIAENYVSSLRNDYEALARTTANNAIVNE
ncbi:desmoplakin [Rachiplusia nu nucleopolyhedrovirus]|uniref:Desmoplakin n=1 Tax=Rachiplusia nu nucleopolyhedrovirus TaxID=2605775 RepID=A0AAE6IRC0_9ABAC|nr:desmoplakin [Rachiplusia nu nucleopolyhedrovirus]QEI03603.1 desmoplakin [Rachiplusia nu nucleopolyhedrovirus]